MQGTAVLLMLALLGCSHNAESSSPEDASASSSERPPIHYDQTAVLMVDGQAQEEKAYRSLLDACKKSGMPTHELTQDEVGKIGRLHVEAWIGPDTQAKHTEEWHQNAGSPCQFTLIHKDQTEIIDAQGRSTLIDAATHKAEVQELGAPTPVTPLPAGDGNMDDAAKQAGWSKLSDASANGAACSIWQNAQGLQLCVWKGGAKWGYSSYGVDALKDGMSQDSSIVLWSRPGKGAAWSLETRVFTVGQPLDQSAFKVPDGVAVSAASP